MRRSVVLVLILLAAGCGAQSPSAPPPSASETSSRPPSALRPPGPLRPTAQRRPAREPTPAAEARPVKVPYTASGRYSVVRGRAPARPGPGEVVRYLVEVEGGLPFDGDAFAAAVHRTLNDPRGWAPFQRVDHGPVRVRVALSSPAMTDRQCLPLRTGGDLSCWNGTRSIINARRWAAGVPQYEGDLAAYRDYVISHEVGHSLGHGHTGCPGPGRPAPVMAQQSKSLGGCRPNPWPYPSRPKDRRPGRDR
ncbi:hypothetical protein GCM10012289_12130 [Nonomuraea cavernae]|uniref:DUF3152 domain-containing protein n=1 Tax=Nonomuraea cavernae TaxID=2045107 RepID=A0A917YRH6_9ACTN|nr:hypothetical protein GCM10012289_12130 [Nonomuraea cavernae]